MAKKLTRQNPKINEVQIELNGAERILSDCKETLKESNDESWIQLWMLRVESAQKQVDFLKNLLADAKAEPEETMPYDDFYAAKQTLNGMDKWSINRILDKESNKIPENNGYFGAYTCITYFGKQAIVYVDDRNAKVVFKTPFYDKIMYLANRDMRWDGDKRWSDYSASIIICQGGLYNLITERDNGAPICREWYKNINPEKKYINPRTLQSKAYYDAETQSGEHVMLSMNGYPIVDNAQLLAKCKAMSREEILEQWIKAGKLVVGGCGWQYRGAKTNVIDNELAAKEFDKYSFGKGFYEMEWVEYKGEVALSMREYSALDME